ncbi:hypothetical protein PVT71_18155 [Salipiger sp. H15]|uniref:Uncharacterized protein n=1 Tax=Alloyangia sp. H15 TaxID=3029062 RepID=A0AAU8AR23_9RHOB
MSGLETSSTVENLAAEALSVARVAATAIREDVLHRLAPRERTGPERLLRMLEARKIFEVTTLDHLNALESKLAARIIEGTLMVERFEGGEGNVSPISSREPRLTEEADGLSNALSIILELIFLLEITHDRLAAEAAVEALHQSL